MRVLIINVTRSVSIACASLHMEMDPAPSSPADTTDAPVETSVRPLLFSWGENHFAKDGRDFSAGSHVVSPDDGDAGSIQAEKNDFGTLFFHVPGGSRYWRRTFRLVPPRGQHDRPCRPWCWDDR